MIFTPSNLVLTLIAITILLVSDINAQRCMFRRADLLIPDRVFFINDILLTKISMSRGDMVKLSCADTESYHTCQDDIFNPPLTECSKRLKPEVVKEQCSAYCAAPASMYTVGFRSGSQFSVLYHSCYHVSEVRPIFVWHAVHRVPMIASRPEQGFTSDRIISEADTATFKSENIFNRFVTLLGDKQHYIKDISDSVIHRGHLAAAGDFLFIENKRSTFKYINVMPMFASINTGSWSDIEKWIRCWYRDTIFVNTFSRGVLDLPHSNDANSMVDMYLGEGKKNPIPKWLMKNVNNEYLFVVYNNPFAVVRPPLPCVETECPDSVTDLKNFSTGYTSCCEPWSSNPSINC